MRIVMLFLLVSLNGCVTQPNYTQAQLNSIETRIVDADFDETFNAASNALFDAGYTVSMSDREGGLITGTKGKDNTAARIWISPAIRDTAYALSIQVREEAPQQCRVRVKSSVNGEPVVEKEAIDQIWVLMQRQVLMQTPPSVAEN